MIHTLRRHPVFFALLGVMGLALLTAAWLAQRNAREWQAAKRQLHARQQEERQAAQAGAGKFRVEAIRREREENERVVSGLLAGLRGPLQDETGLTDSLPEGRTGAFFEIGEMVARLREVALRYEVGLKPDERFGFGAYAQEGPEPGLIPEVSRQCGLVERIVTVLLESGPGALLSVQRERPERDRITRSGMTSPDYFEMDPRLSVRREGVVKSTAFKLCFSGETPVLRTFLNAVTRHELPLAVRAVEAEPAPAAGKAGPQAGLPEARSKLRGGWGSTLFTVTIEHFELSSEFVSAEMASAVGRQQSELPVAWSAPRALVRGPAWIYELFTPPELHYDEGNGRWHVVERKPVGRIVAERVTDGMGLELIAVKPTLFPLQLVGHIGEPGNARGVFENMETGEVWLASAGDRLERLGLMIGDFKVGRQPVAGTEGMISGEWVAEAVIRDIDGGGFTMLTSRERVMGPRLLAQMRVVSGDGAEYEVGEGDRLSLGESSYRIESIQLMPPLVEVSLVSEADPLPALFTLTPHTP